MLLIVTTTVQGETQVGEVVKVYHALFSNEPAQNAAGPGSPAEPEVIQKLLDDNMEGPIGVAPEQRSLAGVIACAHKVKDPAFALHILAI